MLALKPPGHEGDAVQGPRGPWKPRPHPGGDVSRTPQVVPTLGEDLSPWGRRPVGGPGPPGTSGTPRGGPWIGNFLQSASPRPHGGLFGEVWGPQTETGPNRD